MVVQPLLEYLDGVLGQVAAPLADGHDAGWRVGHAAVDEADSTGAVGFAICAALVVVCGRGRRETVASCKQIPNSV